MNEQERLQAHLDRLVAAVDAAEAAPPEHRRLVSSKDGSEWCDECEGPWDLAHPAAPPVPGSSDKADDET